MLITTDCTVIGEINTEDIVYQYDSETASILLERGYTYDIVTLIGKEFLVSTVDLKGEEDAL